MRRAIYPIVEGQGEERAVPVLIGRFAREVFQQPDCKIFPPHRLARSKILNEAELGRALNLAALKLRDFQPCASVLLLADADKDLPCQLGPRLVEIVARLRSDLKVSVVLANREYEAWFLAAIESLRSSDRVRSNAKPPRNPEGIRGCKERLENTCLVPGAKYAETVDQEAFTRLFSFDAARMACTSFDKLWREMQRIFTP